MKDHKSKILFFAMLLAMVALLSMAFVTAAQSTVDLGTAGNFVILTKSGISTTGTTSIVGDIGVSPIGSTAITGFGLIIDSSNQFSTSSLVDGNVYAADYASPTPSYMTTAISNMETAYTDAAARTLPDYTELGSGDIGGLTLAPGLYKWGTGVTIPTDVTINGSSSDIWIFQIAGTLSISSGKKIILSGGAQAKNIFWQVADTTTLGTTSVFNGNILDRTAIVIETGATLNGRALAQTAVTLDANNILIPDIQPPVITILGVNPVNIAQNATYNDTGATALDDVSGVVSVSSFGTVDTTIIGVYNITYNATDTAGNTATAIRTINVLSAQPVLTTINVSLTSVSLVVGSTQQLNATGFDQFGDAIAAIVNYTTNDSSVATVDITSGIVTAVASGNALITASSDLVNRSVLVTVSPVVDQGSGGGGGGGGGGGSGGSGGRLSPRPASIFSDVARTCSEGYRMNEREVCVPVNQKQVESVEPVLVVDEIPQNSGLSSITGGAITGIEKDFMGITFWGWIIIAVIIGAIIIFIRLLVRR
ncbi:MAG: ice-binding family protein [Nanoarchaeota archaeon]|nr:ice-binding family protein [Nanoarchaeota archaeon]